MGLGRWAVAAAILVACAWLIAPAAAQQGLPQLGPRAAPTQAVTVGQLPPAVTKSNFSADKATAAYLDQVNPAVRARSNAYTDGNHWLILWDALYTIAVAALLLWLGLSAAMRNVAQTITNSRFWQVPIYVGQFVVVVTVLTLPLAIYQDYFREHAYGLSNQTFFQWLADFGIGFGIELIAAIIILAAIYAVIRASHRLWWLWGTIVTVLFLALYMLVYPVLVAPLTNTYTPLPPGPLKTQIQSMAKANGISANDIYQFNESKQDNRISANVSGLFGTTRIALNDNLLKRCNTREILAVVGHEIGHYVLDHAYILLTWYGLLILIGFAFVHWGFGVLTARFGGEWGVRTLDDPAGLPVLMALFTAFMLVATPARSTISRTIERQADIFGLNAARQPDGFATVALKLAPYRKLDPGPLEEIIFYDHPSGRDRIAMAMRWKAQHLRDADIAAQPISPQ